MKFYVPRIVLQWKDGMALTGEGVKPVHDTIGYMPVFTDLATLRQHFPTTPYDVYPFNGKEHKKPFTANKLRPHQEQTGNIPGNDYYPTK